ncbi:MAG: CPBP family intramembrane metalloprotease [Firmicutes bacterium]|nr:CPBP family intramembrane metalloprotease [Bacillota bacterium]
MAKVDWRAIPWGAREVFVYILLLVAALIALIFLTSLLGFLLVPLSPMLAILLAALAQGAVMVALIFLPRGVRGKEAWRNLGLGAISRIPWLKGLGGGLGLLAASWLYGLVVSHFVEEVPTQAIIEQFMEFQTLSGMLVFGFLVVILAPVTEELVFRGFIFGGVRNNLGFWGAALFSSLAFTVIHLSFHWVPFIQILILGVGLAWLYEASRNLLAPMLAHAVYNLAIAILLVVSG